MDKRALLDRFASEPEDRLILAQFIDKAAQCARSNIPTATAFLNPRQQMLATQIARQTNCGEHLFFGGHEEAERRIALFLPDWVEPDQAAEYAPIKVLRITWAAQAKAALSHRDFLGALMGCGIQRDAIGDIFVRELACDLIVTESISPFIEQNLVSVGRANVSISEIQPEEIELLERKVRIIRDTVASLRLDAVVSTGFSMSRERAQELIRTGHAVLNNLLCEKPDRTVSEGDVVSARGFGKFKLVSCGNVSKKGRIWIEVERYE